MPLAENPITNYREHELLALGGNDEPETAPPTVQQRIESLLNPTCSHPSARCLTNDGSALFKIGKAKVLIGHDVNNQWRKGANKL